MGPSAGTVLVLVAAAYAGCLVAALLWPAVGHPLLGVVVLGLVGWLAAHDVARRTVRSTALARFAAVGMLAGYAWLAVAGALWLVGTPTGAAYDAVVHAVFLGFTMSMVMAHAPVILPVVARVRLPFHPALYVPLTLLQLGLVIRLWPGDALGITWAWQLGGVLTVLALVTFMACVLTLVVASERRTQ